MQYRESNVSFAHESHRTFYCYYFQSFNNFRQSSVAFILMTRHHIDTTWPVSSEPLCVSDCHVNGQHLMVSVHTSTSCCQGCFEVKKTMHLISVVTWHTKLDHHWISHNTEAVSDVWLHSYVWHLVLSSNFSSAKCPLLTTHAMENQDHSTL